MITAGEGRRRKADKGTTSAGELTSAEEESEVEKLMDTDAEQSKTSRPRPQPRPIRRGTRRTRANPNPEDDGGEEQERINDENGNETEAEPQPENSQVMVTPKANRTRSEVATPLESAQAPVPTGANAGTDVGEPITEAGATESTQQPLMPGKEAQGEEHGEEVSVEETTETPKVNKTKKRTREDEDTDMEGSPQVESPPDAEASRHEQPSTPVDDVHIRRKRIRR